MEVIQVFQISYNHFLLSSFLKSILQKKMVILSDIDKRENKFHTFLVVVGRRIKLSLSKNTSYLLNAFSLSSREYFLSFPNLKFSTMIQRCLNAPINGNENPLLYNIPKFRPTIYNIDPCSESCYFSKKLQFFQLITKFRWLHLNKMYPFVHDS